MESKHAEAPPPWYRRAWVSGMNVWDWVQCLHPYRAFSHFTNVGGGVLSGGMSYLAIFAVFAALAVGFGAFGFELRSRPDLLKSLVEQINTFVPGLVNYEGSGGAVQIDSLLTRSALSLTTIIASVSLLWVAMSWFTGTRRSIRIIFGLEVKQYRNFWLLKLRDLVLAIAFAVAILMSAGLTVVSSHLFDSIFEWAGWNSNSWLLDWAGRTARYLAMLIFDLLLLLGIHHFLAEVRAPKRRLFFGCLLGAIAFGVLKYLGTSLLGGATRNPLLASFAVMIGLLIWFNLICRALLLTSSWIATGMDRTLGVPDRLLEARADEQAAERAHGQRTVGG